MIQSRKKTRPAEVFFDGRMNIVWKDEHHSGYDYWDLRTGCPCAGCIDEVTGEKILDDTTVDKNIHPTKSQYVGNYALRIFWSDGHDTGIYSFQSLRKRCSCDTCTSEG